MSTGDGNGDEKTDISEPLFIDPLNDDPKAALDKATADMAAAKGAAEMAAAIARSKAASAAKAAAAKAAAGATTPPATTPPAPAAKPPASMTATIAGVMKPTSSSFGGAPGAGAKTAAKVGASLPPVAPLPPRPAIPLPPGMTKPPARVRLATPPPIPPTVLPSIAPPPPVTSATPVTPAPREPADASESGPAVITDRPRSSSDAPASEPTATIADRPIVRPSVELTALTGDDTDAGSLRAAAESTDEHAARAGSEVADDTDLHSVRAAGESTDQRAARAVAEVTDETIEPPVRVSAELDAQAAPEDDASTSSKTSAPTSRPAMSFRAASEPPASESPPAASELPAVSRTPSREAQALDRAADQALRRSSQRLDKAAEQARRRSVREAEDAEPAQPPVRRSSPRIASEPRRRRASARGEDAEPPSRRSSPRIASEPGVPNRATSEPSGSGSGSGRAQGRRSGASSSSGNLVRQGRASTPPPAATDAAPSAGPTKRSWLARVLYALPWIVIALPALYQLVLLSTAISARVGYPYDLEWMEGGMLHHALRIHNGEGIYVPPSIDFIPYLYTPLYPSLLALFGSGFGITYVLGRAVSVLALIGIGVITAAQVGSARHQHVRHAPVWAGVALALGLFAAVYPYLEGWFDLVRADTLFLFMITAGIAGLPRWSRTGRGIAGHGRVAAGAALLALAFFCKQTGIIYVAFGGLIVLVLAWRRAFTYVAIAGAIGLGGVWLLDRTTHGWFWTYVSEIHRAHDFNMDRFWKSFSNILWHFPLMSIVIAAALVVVLVTVIGKRMLPRQAHALLLWSATYAVSTVVGAIGWGTEFAHFNAYMPAFLHGAMAAGAAIPAVYGCSRVWWGGRKLPDLVSLVVGLAFAVPLALTCWTHRWKPEPFMPTDADVAAGARLVERLRGIEGEVWMPSHPWYLHLAGKTPRVHRMGIKDVTTRQTRNVEGLDQALAHHAFTAIVLDDRDLQLELPQIRGAYRPAFKLPADERPRVFTGAQVTPDSIWLPAVPAAPPANVRVLFDFEAPVWAAAWTHEGAAWGNGPVGDALPGQEMVLGASGQRFATSMNTGDVATGRLSSPPFPLDGSKLTLRLGGGTDASKLRVELWVDGAIVRTASVPEPGGDTLKTVTIELGELRGKTGKLVLVDDASTSHLDLDDVWIWP